MKKGFTLIELLVVIAIIGILAGVLMASFSGGTESARAAKCLNNMRNLAQASISYAMKTDYYPAAGSYARMKFDQYNKDFRCMEGVGWISWLSMDDPYRSHHDAKSRPKTFQRVPSASACCSDIEKATFAITNGALWTAMRQEREAYTCPLHLKLAQDKHLAKPHWSYVMNARFGYSPSGCSKIGSAGGFEFGHISRPDRLLMFAELPFAVTGASDSSNEVDENTAYTTAEDTLQADCTLQYKASVNGKNYGAEWSQKAEAIHYNHRSGKNYFAHVAFADGHTERLMKPKTDSGLNAVQLTALLCNGADVSFTGGKYELVTDGDK